jgi:hypothetical protein
MIGNLINFQKMRQVADLIRLVEQYQHESYKFSIIEHVR